MSLYRRVKSVESKLRVSDRGRIVVNVLEVGEELKFNKTAEINQGVIVVNIIDNIPIPKVII